MLKALLLSNMQNKYNLNNTRLSMALMDLPLTPIGMKNNLKKKAICSFGKENHAWNPRSLQKKFDNYKEGGSRKNTGLAASVEEIPTFNEEIDSSKSNTDSVYTKVDDGSFVEFYSHGFTQPDTQKQLYYTCLTHTDTIDSTSSKRPSALVGFRQYVEALKGKQYQLPSIPDNEPIVSGAITNTGRKFAHQVLNSTAKNESFWNYDFPDISSLKISSALETVNEKNSSIVSSDNSIVKDSVIETGIRGNDKKRFSPLDTFITEDVSICSSASQILYPIPVQTSSKPLPDTGKISDPLRSPKKDVMRWVMSSPFKSPEAVNDGEFIDKFSQDLLKLSGKSVEPLHTNKPNVLNVREANSLKHGRDTISATSYFSTPRPNSRNPQLQPRKRSPAIIVNDSDEQSSDDDLVHRRVIRRNRRVIISSPDEPYLTNVNERTGKLFSKNPNNTSGKPTRNQSPVGISQVGSNSQKIHLHLDTLEDSSHATLSDGENIIIAESDEDSYIIGATGKKIPDESINEMKRNPWRSPCSHSPGDSSPYQPHLHRKLFNSKTRDVLSSSDLSSNNSVCVISDDEDHPDTFLNLRKKLQKLIETKSTNVQAKIAEKENEEKLARQSSFKSPPGHSFTEIKLNRHLEDNAFNTSDSEEDCLFTSKNSQPKKYTKPRLTPFKTAKSNKFPVYEQGTICQKNMPGNCTRPETISFLLSICMRAGEPNLHPDAIPFLKSFSKIKLKLSMHLYAYFNEHVFESKLPSNMSIKWNSRIRKTAGYCYYQVNRAVPTGRDARIELSTKVIDSPDRLRDTLLHEMCHAASWIVSGYKSGHGPLWKAWVSKAMTAFPELPLISRCHSYEIACKYTYQCTKCGYSIGRHSKSLDVEKKVCGRCYGHFKLVVTSTLDPTSTPKTPRTPGPFAVFVRENYSSVKSKRQDTHADVMKELSKQFNVMKLRKRNND